METNRTHQDRLSPHPVAVVALVSLLALGGCSSFDVPDAINPGKWDFFSDDAAAAAEPAAPAMDMSMDSTMDMTTDVRPATDMLEAPPPPAMPTVPVEEAAPVMAPSEPAPVAMPQLHLRAPSGVNAPMGEPFNTVVISSSGVATTEPMASSMMTPIETISNTPLMAQSQAQVQFPKPGMTTSRRGQEAVGGMLRLATLYFRDNSDVLDRRDLDIVAAVAQLRKERGGRLFVVGHASSRTRDMEYVRHALTNFNVSSKRANAVAKALSRAGVAGDQVQVHAVSDTVPLYYEVMPSGEAGNRRVEIYLAP